MNSKIIEDDEITELDKIHKALYGLFDVWISPYSKGYDFEGKTGSIYDIDIIEDNAYKFYALNMYSCERVGLTPKHFIRHYEKIK